MLNHVPFGTVPLSFMRYEYLGSNENDFKPVEEFTIKVATIKDLNDPYECAERVPPMEGDKIRNVLKNSPALESLDSAHQEKIIGECIAKQSSHQNSHKALEQQDQFDENDIFGILCLSRNCDSTLMWSHYANKHNGYCIGFDENDPWFHPVDSIDTEATRSFKLTPASNYISRIRSVTYLKKDEQRPIKTNKSILSLSSLNLVIGNMKMKSACLFL